MKYVVPGRRLKDNDIPSSTLLLGGLLGIVGFFVIPVIGLLIGFVLGVYLAELRRVGSDAAWPATKHALKAVGLSILIELVALAVRRGHLGARRRTHLGRWPSSSRSARPSPTASRTSSAASRHVVRRSGRSP